jgi:hypothetical protein
MFCNCFSLFTIFKTNKKLHLTSRTFRSAPIQIDFKFFKAIQKFIDEETAICHLKINYQTAIKINVNVEKLLKLDYFRIVLKVSLKSLGFVILINKTLIIVYTEY